MVSALEGFRCIHACMYTAYVYTYSYINTCLSFLFLYQLNDNGYFTLGTEENTFEPQYFPRENLSVPIIAPYWQDFDIYGTGEIYYRVMTDSLTTTRVAFEVLLTFGVVFRPKVVLIATWDHVGYYLRQTDKVMLNLKTSAYIIIIITMKTVL